MKISQLTFACLLGLAAASKLQEHQDAHANPPQKTKFAKVGSSNIEHQDEEDHDHPEGFHPHGNKLAEQCGCCGCGDGDCGTVTDRDQDHFQLVGGWQDVPELGNGDWIGMVGRWGDAETT